VRLIYDAKDPYEPQQAKDADLGVKGDVTFTPSANGGVQAGGQVTTFPSNEAYQYKPDGTTSTLFNLQATTSETGPALGLPFQQHIGDNVTPPAIVNNPDLGYPNNPISGYPYPPVGLDLAGITTQLGSPGQAPAVVRILPTPGTA
jgi:hypothetical protein